MPNGALTKQQQDLSLCILITADSGSKKTLIPSQTFERKSLVYCERLYVVNISTILYLTTGNLNCLPDNLKCEVESEIFISEER